MAAGGGGSRQGKNVSAVAPGAVGCFFGYHPLLVCGRLKGWIWALLPSLYRSVKPWEQPPPSQQPCLPGTSPRLPKISPPQSSHSSDCPGSVCRALPAGLSTELYIMLGLGLGWVVFFYFFSEGNLLPSNIAVALLSPPKPRPKSTCMSANS